MSVLVARGLRKTYGEGELATEVLKGIDLELPDAAFFALVGPSGSGKSTLLSILGTLLRPTEGELTIAGREVGELDERELTRFRNRHLGFVFQFHHLLPEFSALENVVFPSMVAEGERTPRACARARDLLVKMGLEDRVDYLASALSGGQKQRVAVARAVMMRPDLVLADEPTGNLDRESSFAVIELLRALRRDERTAFLISTHDPAFAERCDRVIHLVDGRIVDVT